MTAYDINCRIKNNSIAVKIPSNLYISGMNKQQKSRQHQPETVAAET